MRRVLLSNFYNKSDTGTVARWPMRMPKHYRAAIKKWLYKNDTMLWAMGWSRSYVAGHHMAAIIVSVPQLRMLAAIAPCLRWRGHRGLDLFFSNESLTGEMWLRVDSAIRYEAALEPPLAPMNKFTLARALSEYHQIRISPRAVAASRAYARLVDRGLAMYDDGKITEPRIGNFSCA